jgi:hypothetical protein
MRISVWAALLAAAALAGAGCSGGRSDGSSKGAESAHEAFGKLSVDELSAKMDEAKAGKVALYIIDNNHKDRFEKGHIPGAKWLDYEKVQASDLPPDKEATLVFYCANEH